MTDWRNFHYKQLVGIVVVALPSQQPVRAIRGGHESLQGRLTRALDCASCS
jgi:hypothetical protein